MTFRKSGGFAYLPHLLALITAFCSLIYEFNLSQTLSATLGGTYLRYATAIGIFTFALGLGSCAYGFATRRYGRKKLLLASQFALCVLGAMGPWWVALCNPHGAEGWQAAALEALSYVPVLVIGLLSGLELPLLMSWSAGASASLSVLAFDYFGMFLASVAFPAVLMPQLGVFGTSALAAALNGGCFLLGLGMPEPGLGEALATPRLDESTPTPMEGSAGRGPAFLGLVMLLSFCAFSYELLIARAMGDLVLDEVLSQSVSIGCFLLGLGAGSWLISRRKIANPIRALFFVEVAITVIGAWSILLIFGGSAALQVLEWFLRFGISSSEPGNPYLLAFFQPLVFLLGLVTGFELPLALKSNALKGFDSLAWPLSFAYFGNLVAGFVVPLVLVSKFGMVAATLIVALLNFTGCVILYFWSGYRWKARTLAWLLIPAAGMYGAARLAPEVQQDYLKIHYLELRLPALNLESVVGLFKNLAAFGPVKRIETPYQTADIIDASVTKFPEFRSDFTLYLNRQPQFSASTYKSYHEAFAHGAINLNGQTPRDALILGGGDGLLAAELLKVAGIRSITLVELDPVILDLARNSGQLRQLNQGALDDPRVRVRVDDAFRFVQRQGERFDAIFVDFPYPTSFDLLKLFSVEFYGFVRARLNPGGFAVMDAPIWKSLDEVDEEEGEGDGAFQPRSYEILLSTVRKAGFKTTFSFGPLDPLLFLKTEESAPQFDYGRLPEFVSNRGLVNMTDLRHIVEGARLKDEFVNSIFKPVRFR